MRPTKTNDYLDYRQIQLSKMEKALKVNALCNAGTISFKHIDDKIEQTLSWYAQILDDCNNLVGDGVHP
jgi:hypothetical protein